MATGGGPLPSNVTRTRGSVVKRFGVKIRFHGYPLRIGSAYSSPQDASTVASIFRKVASIDRYTGLIKFTDSFVKDYKNTYVYIYLPFTRTKDRIQVTKYLLEWLENWKEKQLEAKKTKTCLVESPEGKVSEGKGVRNHKNHTKKSLGKRFLDSKVEAGDGGVKPRNVKSRRTSVDVVCGRKVLPDAIATKMSTAASGDDDSSIKIVVNSMERILKRHGFSRLDNLLTDSNEWRNDSHEITFFAKRLPNMSLEGTSSGSNSTEEAESSTASQATSDSEFDNITMFDEMSYVHIDNVEPERIYKHNVNCPILVAINGIWDSSLRLQGVLEMADGDGSLSELPIFDSFYGDQSNGTLAYVGIDLKKFAAGSYYFSLRAKDGFDFVVGKSNRVELEIVEKLVHANDPGSNRQTPKDEQDDFDGYGKRNSSFKRGKNEKHSKIEGEKDNDGDAQDKSNDKDKGSGQTDSDTPLPCGSISAGVLNAQVNNTHKLMSSWAPKSALDPFYKMTKAYLPSISFSNRWTLGFSVVFLCIMYPSLQRYGTQKTDPFLQSSYRMVENAGLTGASKNICKLFADKSLCDSQTFHVSLPSGKAYGPEDYYSRGRDPMSMVEHIGRVIFNLPPLINFALIFGFLNRPYMRDRFGCFCVIMLCLLESFHTYAGGYSLAFCVGSLLSCVVIASMELYISLYFTVAKYSRYRLEYFSIMVMLIFLCQCSARPWAVENFGKATSSQLPVVTLAFSPLSQKVMSQSVPFLLASKSGYQYNGLPILGLAVGSFALSLVTAASASSLNMGFVFQLWPYYMGPYLYSFFFSYMIMYTKIAEMFVEPFLVQGNYRRLKGWYL